MHYTSQPPKLLDCRVHGPQSGAELLIVEGDSASQAVAKQRDSKWQAVLPMQGKPMNPMRTSLQNLEANVLYAALIQAIGAGVGDHLGADQRRYERIVLLMDPDADGIHCGALMTLFFYQWMRPLLEAGSVYLVRAPVGHRQDALGNKTFYYRASDFEQQLTEEVNHETMMKYRGLAGIPPQHLARCCLVLETRAMLKLGIKDAQMAKQIFS